jgi:hypothetical protein
MNISITLNDEQTASLEWRVDAHNAAHETTLTASEYLEWLLNTAVASYVSDDIRNTALSIEAASRQLPDASRLAFTADVQTLFQEYASGQKP